MLPGGTPADETTTYCLVALLAANGAEVLGPDGIRLDSPNTVQVLRFVAQLVAEGLVPRDVVRYRWDRPARMLADGTAAFSFGGSYEASTIAETMGVPLERLWDHVGFTAVPSGPKGKPACVLGSMAYVILRQASQPMLAMRALEYLVDTERLVQMARHTGRIPPRRSALAQISGSPLLEFTSALVDQAAVRPQTAAYVRVSVQLQSMTEAVITGRLGPAAAATRASEMIEAITGLPIVASTVR